MTLRTLPNRANPNVPPFQDWELLRMADHQLKKWVHFTPREAGREPVLLPMDYEAVPAVASCLPRFKADRVEQVFLPIVEVPSTKLADPQLRGSLQALDSLWRDKVIACSLLVDRPHRYGLRQARQAGQLVQERKLRLLARSLNGMFHLHHHHEVNGTGADLFEELGEAMPFVGLAPGSIGLEPGGALSPLNPGRWFSGRVASGKGDVEHTRASLLTLGKQLLTNEQARLFPTPLDPQRHLLIGQVFVPFRHDDPRDGRYKEVCDGLEASDLPGTRLVFLSGGGEPDGSVATRFYGQFTWWWAFGFEDLTSLYSPAPTNAVGRGNWADRGSPQRRTAFVDEDEAHEIAALAEDQQHDHTDWALEPGNAAQRRSRLRIDEPHLRTPPQIPRRGRGRPKGSKASKNAGRSGHTQGTERGEAERGEQERESDEHDT
jgi:hypothetical protein